MYLVLLQFLINSNSHSVFKLEGKIKFIAVTYMEVEGKLSTIDLLELTSSDELLFILKILPTFVAKEATIMRRSTVLSFSLQLVFPELDFVCPSRPVTCTIKHYRFVMYGFR
jgi:hypothetical protein